MRENKVLLFLFLILFCSDLSSKSLNICNFYTEKFGKKFNLPTNLLTSISLVESGIKKENKNFSSWPWTLNVEGKPIYFDTKEDVINYLEQNKDKKSIDVGCMQINTKYHMSNFNSFAQMIEPEENVRYAAIFLAKLFKRHKSWNKAISRYHSSNPNKQRKYLKKVYSFWNNLRQKKIVVKKEFVEKNRDQIEFFKNVLDKERI